MNAAREWATDWRTFRLPVRLLALPCGAWPGPSSACWDSAARGHRELHHRHEAGNHTYDERGPYRDGDKSADGGGRATAWLPGPLRIHRQRDALRDSYGHLAALASAAFVPLFRTPGTSSNDRITVSSEKTHLSASVRGEEWRSNAGLCLALSRRSFSFEFDFWFPQSCLGSLRWLATCFGTREKLPTPPHQKLTNNPALATEVRRLTATRHRRRG